MTGTELEIIESGAPVNLFGAASPTEVVRRATEHAEALADVIRQKHLYKTIGNKNHVLVEGWCLLGSMLGVFPVVVWTRQLEEGWEARVEARTLSGQIVGAAEAECLRTEKTWKGRDDYALRSMAQTRAMSKALRGPLGFIVSLAGYNATPAEEIPVEPRPARQEAKPKKTPQQLHAHLNAMCSSLDEAPGTARSDGKTWTERSREIAAEQWGVKSRAELNAAQLEELIQMVDTESVPFG